MSRAEIGRQRRQRNLAGALRAITAKITSVDGGLGALSMADLVDSSTLSRGTFYSHFADRAAVAHSLATFANLTVELQIESTQSRLSGALERIGLSYHTYLAFAIDNGPLAIVMIDDFVGRFPEIRTYLPEVVDRGERVLHAAIEEGDLTPKALLETTRDVVAGGLALTMKRLSCASPATHEWLADSVSGLLVAVGADASTAEAASKRGQVALGIQRDWPVESAALAAAKYLEQKSTAGSQTELVEVRIDR